MKSKPFEGRYLFHFHTQQTDGKLTVGDYFAWAKVQGVQSLLFLEHVRRQPSYDVSAFVEEVKGFQERSGIKASIGFEAKLLPDGTLDISDEHCELAEIVGIAEHSFPNDVALLQSAFQHAVKTLPMQFRECCFVWVHPGLWFKKRGIEQSHSAARESMLQCALKSGVFIERNLRYGLLDESLLYKVPPELLVVGADAHTTKDLTAWAVGNYRSMHPNAPTLSRAR